MRKGEGERETNDRWRRLVGDSEEGFDGGLKAREAASGIHYGHDYRNAQKVAHMSFENGSEDFVLESNFVGVRRLGME